MLANEKPEKTVITGSGITTFMSQAKNSVFPVYVSTLKSEFLNISNMDGVLQKVYFQGPKQVKILGLKKNYKHWSSLSLS